MTDDLPPWERKVREIGERQRAASEARELQMAQEYDAVMERAPYASDHLPEYDSDGGCCHSSSYSITGCSCAFTGVHDEDSWKAHVDEVQRRDRERVSERGGEPHGMPWKNPYEEA